LLADLPRETKGAHAAVMRSAMSLAALDAPAAAHHLALARECLAHEPPAQARTCRLPIAILNAVLASLGSDTDAGLSAALSAEKALRLRPPQDLAARQKLVAVVAGCKGRVLFERGDLPKASAALAEGVSAAQGAHLESALSELTGMWALVEAVEGRLRRACDLALRVEPLPGATTGRASLPGSEAATLALAWVRADESEAQAAHDLLGRAETQRVSLDSRALRSVLVLLRCRSLCIRGDFEFALAELRAERSAQPAEVTSPTTGWLESALVLAEARVLTALGQHRDAITMIGSSSRRHDLESEIVLQHALMTSPDTAPDMTRLLKSSSKEAPLSSRIQRSLLLAEYFLQEQDPSRGEQFLEEGLRLGAPENLRRPFDEAGPCVKQLLRTSSMSRRSRWLHLSDDGPLRGRTQVRTAADRYARQDAGTSGAPMVLPLTNRETEVLDHLAELLTTEEIAAAMFVSVNTVRTHVRSLLRKLGVSRRNDAVRRAWDLELLRHMTHDESRDVR
jgi:LuxR family maltose regulon positive regulatory protein